MLFPDARGWLAAAALTSAAAAQTTVVLTPTADNTLYENATGALSNGTGPSIFGGFTMQASERRAVLRFDVASTLPAGATVTEAELGLMVTASNGPAPLMNVHRVTADWGEGTSFANGPGGTGTGSATGDATWIHTFFPSSQWSSAGGDFAATVSSQSLAPTGGTFAFDDPGLIADVQAWVDGSAADYGWLLRSQTTVNGNARRFDSREGSQGPTLTVTYLPPGLITTNYCVPANVNSSGASAAIYASGSPFAADNNLTLTASSVPNNQFGYFIASQTQGFIPNVGGSSGNLCVDGTISRFNAQIQSSGATGAFSISVDLQNFPLPSGTTVVQAGDTWNFQAWFRDVVGGQTTSNFTDGIELSFL